MANHHFLPSSPIMSKTATHSSSAMQCDPSPPDWCMIPPRPVQLLDARLPTHNIRRLLEAILPLSDISHRPNTSWRMRMSLALVAAVVRSPSGGRLRSPHLKNQLQCVVIICPAGHLNWVLIPQPVAEASPNGDSEVLWVFRAFWVH